MTFSDCSGEVFEEDVIYANSAHQTAVCFDDAIFNGDVDFTGATFDEEVDFSNAIFNGEVDFTESTFKGEVDFANVVFKKEVDFTWVEFKEETNFNNSKFEQEVHFGHATFYKETSFREAAFETSAGFGHYTTFMGETHFDEAIFEAAIFDDSSFNGEMFFKNVFFGAASFHDAIFRNDVSFYRSTFDDNTIFAWTVFKKSPTFKEVSFDGRTIFKDANFCVEGAIFSKAHLGGVNFEGVQLERAYFSNADLKRANLSEAHLEGANFQDASLEETDLSEAHLEGVNFQDAYLQGANLSQADLTGANLEDVILDRADLRYATFTDVRWYQALLPNVRINTETDFGDQSVYEQAARNQECKVQTDLEDVHNVDLWHRAEWTYDRLDSICRDNTMLQQARHWHFKQAEAGRHGHWATIGSVFTEDFQTEQPFRQIGSHSLEWGVSWAHRLLTGYGTEFRWIAVWTIMSVLGSALLYLQFGLVTTGAEPGDTSQVSMNWDGFLTALQFSVDMFGFGMTRRIEPLGYSNILVVLQSMFGGLLFGLFGFVLARRLP